jgi:hypothetical protein
VVVVLHGVQGKQKVAVCMFVELCVFVLELPLPSLRTAKVVAPARCPLFQQVGMAEKPRPWRPWTRKLSS